MVGVVFVPSVQSIAEDLGQAEKIKRSLEIKAFRYSIYLVRIIQTIYMEWVLGSNYIKINKIGPCWLDLHVTVSAQKLLLPASIQ